MAHLLRLLLLLTMWTYSRMRCRISFRKIRMKHVKIAICSAVILASVIILLLYYLHLRRVLLPAHYRHFKHNVNQPMRHIPLNEIQDLTNTYDYYNNAYQYLLKTKGCTVPLRLLNYENISETKFSCNKRAILFLRTDEENVKVAINKKLLKSYEQGTKFSHCCYSFFTRSKQPLVENTKLQFDPCIPFKNEDVILLRGDFIKIYCYGNLKTKQTIAFYEDVFGFVNKLKTIPKRGRKKMNVLLIGMSSMSMFRVIFTMPRVSKFFKENYWLAFKGYHKVGDTMFANKMASLTGKNISVVQKACSLGIDYCNNLIIWSKFKKAGYVTAYGEDYLYRPDTFSGEYNFHMQPTDHYMRPLFIAGEKGIGNDSLFCTGNLASSTQILNYALDFAVTYKHQPYFGAFWINSHSHNTQGSPRDFDKTLEDFLFRLTYSRILEHTFVMFFSDQGIRFGPQRMNISSFYDNRMPALFIWIPPLFRDSFPMDYNNAILNRWRMITPYDLHATLYDIYRRASNDTLKEQCLNCNSLFTPIDVNRTCSSVGIDQTICSCHKMFPLTERSTEGYKSVISSVNRIREIIDNIKTNVCWNCSRLTLHNVGRLHYYFDDIRTSIYHIVAFTLFPGNISYEATVLIKNGNTLVKNINVISPYRGLGKCVLNDRDRDHCVCQKDENCKNSLS